MKRRNFLKIFPAAGLSPIMVNGFTMRPFSNSQIGRILNNCEDVQDRVLILIQLKGGNDGVNTLIPIEQYDAYAELRPGIKVPETGVDKFISLDNTLPSADRIGMHPVLTSFKAMYEQGWMRVVQGVGYENINGSHFKGTDLWLSGGDGTPENFKIRSGWMGRALQAMYPDVKGSPIPPDDVYPLGIQVGDPNPSLGFHTETEHQNSINLYGQDPAGFYSLVQTIGGAPLLNVPDSEYGDELRYIMGVEKSVDEYSVYISQAFNAGSNSATAYPLTSLGWQLKTIARLIKGGCKTKIYLCNMGGFDTHGDQIQPEGQITTGRHAELLKNLADSIYAFLKDMNLMGLGEQAMACTFSEFGRCAKENGSRGTDHGTLAPMFLFGKGANAGVSGTNVDLSNLTNDNQLQGQQFDYRQVFTTILQDWLGASNYVLEQTMFDGFQKMPLVDGALVASPDCYIGNVSSVWDGTSARKSLVLSPNPATTRAEVSLQSEEAYPARISLHNLGGSMLQAHPVQVQPGNNRYYIDLRGLPAATYSVRVENRLSGLGTVAKLIKE
jgi:uncharacterized protein (DUF1501 family)